MGDLVVNPGKATEKIMKHQNGSINLISHMDADGICSAALISNALDRLEIRHHVKFVHMLYPDVVEELEIGELPVFTDLGSSQLSNLKPKFGGNDAVVIDHHVPEVEYEWEELAHFNAHLEGIDGVQEISGSGMAYLVAKELDSRNKDLSVQALGGAVGDVQNAWGEVKGYNRRIVEDGGEVGVIGREEDLLLYGRNTRPVFKALMRISDPPVPGVTNSVEGAVSMLKDLDIPYKTEDGYRRPVDLSEEEKRKLASELITRAMSDVPEELAKYVPGLIVGEVYTFLNEQERSLLRGADEFATCINATARHEQPLIGYEVAKGDRGVYQNRMRKLLNYHRKCIAEGMDHVNEIGVKDGPQQYLQYFDASEVLKKTFIGTVASLTLAQDGVDPYRPMLGIVDDDGVAKVSARCSKLLFLRGLDMGQAIEIAADEVEGEGGGHAVACGAQIDGDRIDDFVEIFEDELLNMV